MEQTHTAHNGTATTPGAQRRVLVVEDDPTIVDAIAARLRAEGFVVQTASDGPSAVDTAEAWQPDLLILDIMLPGFDGLEVCRRVQAQRPVPVLMLTARDAFEDKARGFSEGADDYLTKPFDLRELALRCEALARRGQLHLDQEMRVGALTLLLRERRALYQGVPLALTHAGFKLLQAICSGYPHAVSRSTLMHALWGADPPDSDALKSHIYALRKQLESAGAPKAIVTIPQLGYRLSLDV